jgi:hypothetical protein
MKSEKYKWDFLAENWKKLTFPSRPGLENIKYFENLIENKNIDSIAILGSTSEWRNVAAISNANKIFIFEKNSSAYKAMSVFVTDKSKEVLVFGDWFETLPNYIDKFDIILSDLTIGNIPYSDRSLFYNQITASLIKGGVFLDRILKFKSNNDFYDPEILNNEYMNKKINNNNVNDFFCKWLFSSQYLLDHCILDSSYIYNKISNKYIEGNIPQFIHESKKIIPENLLWYYGKLWDEYKNDYLNSRVLIEELPDPENTAYSGIATMLISQKQ